MISFRQLRALLCTSVVIIGLTEFLHGESQILISLGGILALATFVVIFPLASIRTRIIALVLCLGGIVLFIPTGWAGISKIPQGFIEMVPMVALICSVILLGIVMELGNFADLFKRFYAKTKRPYQPYLFSLIISYILSFFSLSGAIAPLYHLISENMKNTNLKNQLFSYKSILHGYGMAIIITPVSATVAVALKYSGLSWLEIAGPVFLFSLTGLLLSFFLEIRNIMGAVSSGLPGNVHIQQESFDSGNYYAKFISFILFFLGVLSCIFLLGENLHFPSLNSISMGCLIPTFLWGSLSGNFRQLLTRSLSFFSDGIIRLSEQIVLLLAAGFFTFSMEQNGGLKWLGYFMEITADRLGIITILAVVPVLITLLALVGIHPFPSSIIMASAISASSLNYEPLAFVIALISGISMGVLVSPFSAIVLVLSSASGESPYKFFHWNKKFMIAFFILTMLFIMLIMK